MSPNLDAIVYEIGFHSATVGMGGIGLVVFDYYRISFVATQR